jgi:hypothetical protein
MGGLEGCDTLDELAHGRPRHLRIFLGRAGQCRLELMAEVRQGLQIRGMDTPCPETGFVIAELALDGRQVASGLLALRCSAAD